VSDAAVATRSLPLRAGWSTHPGRVRTNNEDVPLVDAGKGIFGVIDGVGGHAAGELAAAIASDVILQRLARPLGTPAERVREAIALANNEIFRRAEISPDLRGMTCVVTLAVVTGRQLTVGHVGDTRLYLLRPDGIRKLTHDHSPVGEREDAGEIAETDAMRHPRRNEVFRDVGSALRDKDEEDYVEVIEETLERDAAVLICSDGLTDMVASAAIERIVRRLAGDPAAVTEALVAAANEAGGRDNITVVYAEAPDFAQAVRGEPNGYASGLPQDASIPAAVSIGENLADEPHVTSSPNWFARAARAVVRSRLTWFALGALIGVAAALGLVWRTQAATPPASRILSVGPDGTGVFTSIGEAVQAAHPGDVVRVEPGVYGERIVLTDGVSLVARVPGSVTLVRPPVSGTDWVAITAVGDLTGRISGIRVESTTELPIDVGLRVSGQSRAIDLVELAGPMRAGIEVAGGASAAVHGSHFAVHGTALSIGERAQALVTGNIFVRAARAAGPPVAIGDSAAGTFERNVFAGFGADVVKGLSAAQRQQMTAANVIVTSEPSIGR
jgi:serine/threonine protein phosphatase PrpC